MAIIPSAVQCILLSILFIVVSISYTFTPILPPLPSPQLVNTSFFFYTCESVSMLLYTFICFIF